MWLPVRPVEPIKETSPDLMCHWALDVRTFELCEHAFKDAAEDFERREGIQYFNDWMGTCRYKREVFMYL